MDGAGPAAVGAEALSSLTVLDLKGRLRSRGLPVSGRKSDLVLRLRQAVSAPQQIAPAASPRRLSDDGGGRIGQDLSPTTDTSAGARTFSPAPSKVTKDPPGTTSDTSKNGIALMVLCIFALVLRAALATFGEWQDRTQRVPYTDVDYRVFTDAAAHMHHGRSPYDRATYRYTPLLAWSLQPNVWWFEAFGKVLFVLADVAVGWLAAQCLLMRGHSQRTAALYSCLWLFNPITLVVSTRGNAESLIALSVLATFFFFRKKMIWLAGLSLGLGIHLKVYPIIYSWPLFCDLASSQRGALGLWATVFRPNGQQLKLFMATTVSLSLVTIAMYQWYANTAIVIALRWPHFDYPADLGC